MSKGLLLKGDKDLELVLLCSNKPTVTLLEQVAEKLTAQLEVELIIYSHFISFSRKKREDISDLELVCFRDVKSLSLHS